MRFLNQLLLVLITIGTAIAAAPSILQIDPSSGTTLGGQTVTIYAAFSGGFYNASVTFGGVPAINVVVSNQGSQITLTTTPHAPGYVSVVVTTSDGSANVL